MKGVGSDDAEAQGQLAPLAGLVLPQYGCNVDDKLKSRLAQIGAASR